MAGHRLRPCAVVDPAGADVRPAAGAGHPVAGRRVRRGAGVDPPGRAGAPRSETVKRAGLAGWAPGDRLRRGQGRRAGQPTGNSGAVGTAAFMAPRPAPRTPQALGGSDVFSLGATMLYAATG